MRAAKRVNTPGFLLLVRKNAENGESIRFGMTVTKKLGNAVRRNRIRRRLREVAKRVLPTSAPAGCDVVFIARSAAFDRNFEALLDDLKRALLRLDRTAI